MRCLPRGEFDQCPHGRSNAWRPIKLRKAGIKTASDLRELGADQVYIALLHSGVSPHFIMYYVLHMALQGRAWNYCKGAEKVKLRASFDQICNDHHDPDRSEFERQMDIIGLRAK
ncbi:TfoX/Sxy family DNA transformation protein [Roseobacter sp. HKCCA2468]|uniref:TfoX/Sxy family DNA transformation protein n=1 Tax=Roseobacter sp. HKCCA2468 TaxID=3120342 RepID=UPI0030ECEF0D